MADYYADSDQIRNAAVRYAFSQLGKPYVNTPPGAVPPNSWDCTKLTTWCYRIASNNRINLTPYSYVQSKEVRRLNRTVGVDNFDPGDLLFFFRNGTHHASIYVGNGEIIEASSPSTGVRKTSVWNSWNSANFSWAGVPPRVGPFGGSSEVPGSNGENQEDPEDDREAIEKKTIRRVKSNAIGVSRVSGTPQTGRFAVMNLTNESVYLSQNGSGNISESQFNLVSKTLTLGDAKELKSSVLGGQTGYEITIDSRILQSEQQAKELANTISRTFNSNLNSISISVFGNPLIEIGDIIKFNYENKGIFSSSNEFFIVTKISQSFSSGLQTQITVKPLIESIPVLEVNN